MKSVNSFLVARYIVFAFFTICNAITCSVATWNLSFVHTTKPQQVDIYLIFLGAFSLFSIITLIFVELLCINPFTTRVWFECAWIALFWTMQLAGGAALVAIESNTSCLNGTSEHVYSLCASERVVLAFTWACAIALLVYLLVLLFIAASRHHEDPKIWVSDVRTIHTSMARQSSPTIPHSSSGTRRKPRVNVNVYTPHPMQSKPTQIPHHRGGISPEYKIEPLRPVYAAPERVDLSTSNLPEAIPLPPLASAPIIPSSTKHTPVLPKEAVNTLSLSLGLYDTPRDRVPSTSHTTSNLPSAHVPRKNSTLPTPSPLGDWPRRDIMKQPVKHKHKLTPPSAFEFPGCHGRGASIDASPDTVSQPRARRPSGPRTRAPSGESGHRLPALDLPGIDTGRRDDFV